ncbi:hypothetical protein GCM10009850_116870 [Nonomuraea monospora]|uniref:Uncharacterized protein n=2 Tax=Nonomuraea monospora TaxID=568818 RepID=A0ABP5PZS6_9ACTN
MVILAPPHLTGRARRDWDALQAETAGAPRFDPGQADLLPVPACTGGKAARRHVT